MNQDFKSIISNHKGILYKIARSYASDDDDFHDLYQEILIQIWTSKKKFKKESKLSTWIYRVALNTALTHKKKNQKKTNLAKDIKTNPLLVESIDIGVDESFAKEEKITLLYKCIKQLKKGDRALILLYLEEKKYEEISEITGLTTSHVGVKIKRIKEKLFKLLKENNYARI